MLVPLLMNLGSPPAASGVASTGAAAVVRLGRITTETQIWAPSTIV